MAAAALSSRPAGNESAHSSHSHSRSPSSLSIPNGRVYTPSYHTATNRSDMSSFSSKAHSQQSSISHQYPQSRATAFGPKRKKKKRLRSQYPLDARENHVDYILVASFDIDRGSIMEHQYPTPISGDEHMLAELMLPDQAHLRSQDWTIFFLHKGATAEDEQRDGRRERRRQRRARRQAQEAAHVEADRSSGEGVNGVRTALANGGLGDADDNGDRDAADAEDAEDDDDDDDDDDDYDDDDEEDDDNEELEGPPLIYVLNLVNTKHDASVKRSGGEGNGYLYAAFIFAYLQSKYLQCQFGYHMLPGRGTDGQQPLLLLALEEYFRAPVPETLASLYDAVNSMDISLLPRLTQSEKSILQHSDAKDIFIEKFEQMIQQRMAEDEVRRQNGSTEAASAPARYALPRDTHEFESKVLYNGIPVPIKVPTATSPEMVGDFSLIKLIQTFSGPHASSPQAFMAHAHLTTSGPTTHPIIVLVNALLTQKRIIFLGHNRPSGEVAEVVLAACALASGGLLRGFTRFAFPYTDLTKIDDLLGVQGFIAGVTNPAFAHKAEWWDLLCDISTGRMKISSSIEPAAVVDGLVQQGQSQGQGQGQGQSQQNGAGGGGGSGGGGGAGAGGGGGGSSSGSSQQDATGDNAFMESLLSSIANRAGESVIRARWRGWVARFTRIAAAFEESVYGASALYIGGPETDAGAFGVAGHGYLWADEASRARELAGNGNRVEGWRTTRSYCNYVQDTARAYTKRPVKAIDFMHQHDRLSKLRLTSEQSAAIYLAFAAAVEAGAGAAAEYDIINQLLGVVPDTSAGLFYLSLGLFHPRADVRAAVVGLLERISEHPAGRQFWASLGKFAKLAYIRIKHEQGH